MQGYTVWSFTWADVEDFEGLLDRKQPKTKSLVPKEIATAVESALGYDASVSYGNPIEHLLGYLRQPESPRWRDTAVATAMVQMRGGRPVRVAPEGLQAALVALGSGGTVADDAAGTRMLIPASGRYGLPLVFFFAGPDEQRARATMSVLATLDDSAEEVGGQAHDARWREWLRWGNLAQFLPGSAQLWTRGSLPQLAQTHLPLAHETAAPAIGEDWLEVKELSDPSLGEALVALATSGVPLPVSGDEVGPQAWLVELSWPDAQLVVVIDDDDERDTWLRARGWTMLRYEPGMAAGALVDSVRQALEEDA
jgi:hypothetical protein